MQINGLSLVFIFGLMSVIPGLRIGNEASLQLNAAHSVSQVFIADPRLNEINLTNLKANETVLEGDPKPLRVNYELEYEWTPAEGAARLPTCEVFVHIIVANRNSNNQRERRIKYDLLPAARSNEATMGNGITLEEEFDGAWATIVVVAWDSKRGHSRLLGTCTKQVFFPKD